MFRRNGFTTRVLTFAGEPPFSTFNCCSLSPTPSADSTTGGRPCVCQPLGTGLGGRCPLSFPTLYPLACRERSTYLWNQVVFIYSMSKYLTLLKIRIPSSVPWIFSGVAERAGEAKEKAKVLWAEHAGASQLSPALGVWWWGECGIARRQGFFEVGNKTQAR